MFVALVNRPRSPALVSNLSPLASVLFTKTFSLFSTLVNLALYVGKLGLISIVGYAVDVVDIKSE